MYTQANQVKIDPALQVLFDVAKLVTPTGQPTVAAQMAEAAQKTPQPSQPQGIEAALEQSATAAPSVAQLMQQQQMPPEMPPEMQPQMEPPMEPQGGIASLPVPVGEYAEGGVVGYSGQKGSLVGEGEEEETSIAGDWARNLLGGLQEALRKKSLKSQLGRGIRQMDPGLLEQLTPSERAMREQQSSQMAAMLEAIRGDSGAPMPPAVAAPLQTPSFQIAPGSDPTVLIKQLAAELQASDTSPAAKAALTQKIAELTAQLPPPERQLDRVRAEDVGILTPRPEPAMPSIERPTAASAMEMARLLVPNVDRSESRRLYEERKAQQAASPDFEAMKAKVLEESAAQEQGGRGMEKLLQALSGLSQGGVRGMAGSLRQYEQTTKGLDAAYKQGQIALKEAAQAKAEGNLTKLMEANAKLEDAEAKQADAISRAGIQALSSQSSQYATDVGAARDVARVASAERIARMGGTQGALLDLYRTNPDEFNAFMQASAGGKKTRDAIIAGYVDDYNKLALDPMMQGKLEKQGIKTLDDYIRERDRIASGQSLAANARPADIEAIIQKYSGNK